MAKKRDDFSPADKKALERRVNGTCSNPEHRVPTSGPTVNKKKANSIGVAAHIKAAAPGGARYDQLMTPAERSDISNGIWLCNNCATMIDKDAENYPVSLLHQWKKEAEKYAKEQMGKTPLSRKRFESMEAIIFKDLPKKIIPEAVSEICYLTKEKLEAIDPRFSAEVTYDGSRTAVTFRAKEVVDITTKVANIFAAEFSEKFQTMLDHGQDLEMPAEAITLSGSKLFEADGRLEGKITISTLKRRSAIVKVHVLDERCNAIFSLDDIHGEIVGGLKSATFWGTSFGGLFELECGFGIGDVAGDKESFSMQPNFKIWEDKMISRLPYFEKIYKFYEQLAKKRSIRIVLEIEGAEIFKAISHNVIDILERYRTLRYIHNVRSILKKLKLDFFFQSNFLIPADDVKNVADASYILNELSELKGKDIGKQKLTITIGDSDEAIDAVNNFNSGVLHCIRMKYPNEVQLNLLGNLVKLPMIEVCYTDVAFLFRTKKKIIQPGQSLTVEMKPTETSVASVLLI